MALFIPEELEELRRADEELDADFCQTQEEIVESRVRDRKAALDAMDNKQRKIADYQAAYRAANKDKIADYRDKNREHYNAYMRDYMRKRRAQKKYGREVI